jgi:hypothetical protein
MPTLIIAGIPLAATGEEGSPALESPAKPIAEQEKPSGNGKGEADPEAVINMGGGTIIIQL